MTITEPRGDAQMAAFGLARGLVAGCGDASRFRLPHASSLACPWLYSFHNVSTQGGIRARC